MIKLIVLTIFTIFFSNVSHAKVQFDEDVCRTVGKLSKVIMQKRQEQFPESEMHRILFKKEEEMGRFQHKILKYVVKEAYKIPIYNTMEKQKYAARVFSNKMNGSCLEESSYQK